ncbi:hypothetical protein L6164_003718 [Bauhinia variegata]|uniref:Uncharacterized protein n=1 Tax=Bauhinia variegata TaxID=167791 RepID=A0ACB9Q3P0_BAUVA|nr:hypothetical protein L6164_003718 [Bauhinia variegata]
MASAAYSSTFCNLKIYNKNGNSSSVSRNQLSQKKGEKAAEQISRRELILKTSELATIAAIFNFSGKKPEYLGVQKNSQKLALCPASKNCISTSENVADLTHYAPPWNYNPEGRKTPVNREEAMEELVEVIESTNLDRFTPKIVERKEDYLRVEYQSPILGFVDDVEFWFPPEKNSTVEYRSASRLGSFDFDANRNRKRIKALRQELAKRGWASQDAL